MTRLAAPLPAVLFAWSGSPRRATISMFDVAVSIAQWCRQRYGFWQRQCQPRALRRRRGNVAADRQGLAQSVDHAARARRAVDASARSAARRHQSHRRFLLSRPHSHHVHTHRRLCADRRLQKRCACRVTDRSIGCVAAFRFGSMLRLRCRLREHGHWLIAPRAKSSITRRYRPDTLVLETQFETVTGAATLIDFMPFRGDRSEVRATGRRKTRPIGDAHRANSAVRLRAVAPKGHPIGKWRAARHCRARHGRAADAVHLEGRDMTTVGESTISGGETLPLVSDLFALSPAVAGPLDPMAALQSTERFWKDWSAKCRPAGKWSDAVRRSIITLKALLTGPPAALSPRRPRRCRSVSAASVVGITGSAGCATLRSHCSARCTPAILKRRRLGASGCCVQSPAAPISSR